MAEKLMELSDGHRAAIPGFVDRWIEKGHRTTPLTEDEWVVWEQGARGCYEAAGVPWPGVVVRVPNPLVGALAAPIAQHLINEWRKQNDGAVGGAVGDAVRQSVRSNYYRYFGGTTSGGYYSSWWKAYLAYFRDVVQIGLPDGLWDRFTAFEQAETAGPWWPMTDFVMVCDTPNALHVEQVGERGWGSHRLHCETGPAVGWDGWGVYAWHGTIVPADLIEQGWDTDRILREPNAEIRRCAIERMGWDQFITDAGLQQVGSTVADPGNPGHELALFDVPAAIYETPVRVLLCTNATVERDGTRRRFGLTVPAECGSALEAAGWTFGLDAETYAGLVRAS